MINCVGGKLKVKKEPTINIGVDRNIINLNWSWPIELVEKWKWSWSSASVLVWEWVKKNTQPIFYLDLDI